MLFRQAKDAGAKISFGCQVTSVDFEKPSVSLSNGSEIPGDLIIGADGDRSVVRQAFFGDEKEEEKDDIFTTYL